MSEQTTESADARAARGCTSEGCGHTYDDHPADDYGPRECFVPGCGCRQWTPSQRRPMRTPPAKGASND